MAASQVEPEGEGYFRLSELDGMTADQLVDTLAQISAVENTARVQLLRMVAAAHRSDAWQADGAATFPAWLAWRLRCSFSTASELHRVAIAADSLPAITTSFAEGRLSWDHLRVLVTFATPETDAELAQAAQAWTVRAAERMARLARQKSEREAREEHRSRYARFRWNRRNEMFELHARLADTEGAVMARVLHYLAGGMDKNPATGEWDAFEVRCADALAELASLRLGACQDADRATVVVHAEADVALEGARGSGLIEDGAPICPASLKRLLCDCHIELSLEDPATGRVLGVGRSTRNWPRWLYRAIRERDGGCAFPGCERRAWVHIHHIVHWTDGGPTDSANGVMICPFHHRLVHEGGWRLSGNADVAGDLVFTAPDGRVFPAQRRPLRAEVRRWMGINWNLVDPPWWPWREGLDPEAQPWDVPLYHADPETGPGATPGYPCATGGDHEGTDAPLSPEPPPPSPPPRPDRR